MRGTHGNDVGAKILAVVAEVREAEEDRGQYTGQIRTWSVMSPDSMSQPFTT